VAEGIDPRAVDSLIADLEGGVYGLVDHFLLIRHGRVVADRHFTQDYETIAAQYDTTDHQYNYDHPAWHPYYRDTHLHSLQSVTKSVTSAALGIAIDDGLIEDVHVSVMPFFSDYEHDLTDSRKRAITLEDLLTMRSGIEWNTSGGYDSEEHSTILLEGSEAWIQFVLDQPMDTIPGSVFEYNDGVSVLIGKIVRQVTGQRIDRWATERLFNPIGITDFYWKITPDGEADTEGGLYLSAHDLARIGYLFLKNGEWDGVQIISREWVRASTTPVVSDVAPDNDRADAGYGYQWWVPDHDGRQSAVYAANGYGGQFLLVVPGYDVIAVFNGWHIHGGDFRSTYRALQNRLLPAMER
jgi:CubicO group peptidase (beta-lactamase class C family)